MAVKLPPHSGMGQLPTEDKEIPWRDYRVVNTTKNPVEYRFFWTSRIRDLQSNDVAPLPEVRDESHQDVWSVGGRLPPGGAHGFQAGPKEGRLDAGFLPERTLSLGWTKEEANNALQWRGSNRLSPASPKEPGSPAEPEVEEAEAQQAGFGASIGPVLLIGGGISLVGALIYRMQE